MHLLPLLLLLILPAVAQAQYDYTTNNGTITITGYTGPGGAVTIPSTINGLAVTDIGVTAFWHNGNLTSVTIPDSVATIGSFSSCTNLASVIIGGGVTNISYLAFEYCGSLTNITVSALNATFSSLDGVLFNKPQTTLHVFPAGKVAGYIVPGSVTNIDYYAFQYCSGLINVTIPDSVVDLSLWAFQGCPNLVSVKIGNGVRQIEKSTFENCYKLADLTIGTNVGSIVNFAFGQCFSLTNVTIPNSVTNIDFFAFNNCFSLSNVTFGNGVANLGDTAFVRCSGLTNVIIPDNVARIGNGTFALCTNLAQVTIGNGVTNIGSGAFDSCPNLTNITIGSSVKNIGSYAFNGCSNLTGVFFQGNAPTISSNLFLGATNATVYFLPGTTGWGPTFAGRPTALWGPFPFNYATSNGAVTITGYSGPGGAVTIPDTINGLPVTAIGYGAFAGKTNITDVTIPNSVTAIENQAFQYCGLVNLIIPDSVSNLVYQAFAQCFQLRSVTIGSGVRSISGYTFEGCTNLASINFSPNSHLISISGWAFNSCALTNVTLPDSLTSLTDGAFIRCGNLRSVTIGSGVTNLGTMWAGTFTLCSNLTAVYCLGNAPSGSNVFAAAPNAVVYYLPGTTGWGATFSGQPTTLWKPSLRALVGVSNPPANPFAFDINWASGMTVVVEASTSLTAPAWVPLSTNVLIGGSAYFSDPDPTIRPSRFYRATTLSAGP